MSFGKCPFFGERRDVFSGDCAVREWVFMRGFDVGL
jgi:hypothetical protein